MPITWYTTAPYVFPEAVQRFTWLGFSGTPSVMFDGYESVVGGQPSGSMYYAYQPIVTNHLTMDSPLVLTATYALLGLTGTVSVHVEVTSPVTTADNQIHFVIFEREAHNQVNLARRTAANEPFSLTSPGQTVDVMRDFALDDGWNLDNIGLAVFVQSHAGNKRVLQAAVASPDYAATIVVDATPDGLENGWHLEGPSGISLDGAGDRTLPVFLTGSYTLTWQPVPGWNLPAPASQTQVATQGSVVTFSGSYSGGPFAPVTAGAVGEAGAGRGVNLVDFDGDADLDIYVVNYNQPNRLLRNEGGGAFTDVAAGLVADAGPTTAAAWADFDNDGDLDLYLSLHGQPNKLLRNDGGSFVDATAGTLGNAGPGRAVSWADYDSDGKVDLYLVNHNAANQLYHSYGDPGIGVWFFFEVGGTTQDSGPGAGAAWADYDNDGDPDLYLANSLSANRLFQNNGEFGFWDYTGGGPLADTGNAQSAAWGDYDNDGWLDLYIANDGNPDVLVRNGPTGFSLVTGGPLGDTGPGRGAAWGDWDNDGDLDLYVSRRGQYDLLLRNDGNHTFTRIPTGVDRTAGNGNGAAWGDVDGDGRLDLFLVDDGGGNALLLSTAGVDNHWLQVRLQGGSANASAIGARVRAVTGSRSQLREVVAGSGFCSQNDLTVHFGLGQATVVDTLHVIWPGGGAQTFLGVHADQVLTIPQGTQTSVPAGEAPPSIVRLHPASPNPFNPSTTIRFDLPAATAVELKIFGIDGRRLRTLISVQMPGGRHEVVWDGRDESGRPVASGTYFCRLRAGATGYVGKLTLAK